MDDKQFRTTKNLIEGMIGTWKRTLGLGLWHIETAYHREAPDDMGAPNGQCARMDVVASWEYMRADIRVNMPQMAMLGIVEVEEAVIHELLHCLVCEMREMATHPPNSPEARHHEERVVTHLAKAVYSTRQVGWNDATDAQKRKERDAKAARA